MDTSKNFSGVAAPGLVSADQSGISCMPGRLEGLAGLDWNILLQRSHAIRVVNDAHAALFGEAWQGAAKDLRHVVMLTLGHAVPIVLARLPDWGGACGAIWTALQANSLRETSSVQK